MNSSPNTRPPATTTADWPWAPIPEAVLYDADLDPLAVRVYGCLLRHGLTPGSCYPSHARIGDLIGCSKRSINRPLRALEAAGWVVRVPRFDERGDRTSDGFHVRTRLDDPSAPPALSSVDPRAPERGPTAPGSAHNESHGNESHEREEPLPAPKGAEEDPERGFEVWWAVYPQRNGKRIGKAKCRTKWRSFSLDTKHRIYAATRHYLAAVDAGSTIAKDPERFLAGRYWEDWVDGPGEAAQDAPPASPADGTAKGARNLEERTRRVQEGTACPLCQDAGIVLGEDDLARPCSCRKAS